MSRVVRLLTLVCAFVLLCGFGGSPGNYEGNQSQQIQDTLYQLALDIEGAAADPEALNAHHDTAYELLAFTLEYPGIGGVLMVEVMDAEQQWSFVYASQYEPNAQRARWAIHQTSALTALAAFLQEGEPPSLEELKVDLCAMADMLDP